MLSPPLSHDPWKRCRAVACGRKPAFYGHGTVGAAITAGADGAS